MLTVVARVAPLTSTVPATAAWLYPTPAVEPLISAVNWEPAARLRLPLSRPMGAS
jgi:hypothetical protein